MQMNPTHWVDILRNEYLQNFIRQGGSAVKFAISPEAGRQALQTNLEGVAQSEGFLFAKIDGRVTKLHMVERCFHQIAHQIDWDGLAYEFTAGLLHERGYKLPHDRGEFSLRQVAALNNREEALLRKELQTWLDQAIYRDSRMCQEFRMAMVRLCLAQLDEGENAPFLAKAVKDWLYGELRLISAVKEALIFHKIARHNARHLLASLTHWVRLVGKGGLVLTFDISPYLVSKRPADAEASLYYTASAVMDMYEMLRQFVDGTDEIEGCLMVVVAPPEFLTDQRRGLQRYEALKLRIWDDVRDKHRQNPFAPMIRLSSESVQSVGQPRGDSPEAQPIVEANLQYRKAIEALRAGVPNQDAVHALGCTQPEIEGRFRRLLESAQQSVENGTTTKGLLLEGGFGTGKSHMLEYLQNLASEANFVCSRIVISKETPLYSLAKVHRAAIETLSVPNKRGGTLAEIAGELNFQAPQYSEFYEWVNRQDGELDSRFAATLFLYERMANDQELAHRMVRFWAGDPIGNGELKRYLTACNTTNPYTFQKISATDLALQRFKFVSRLIMAAGYSGWILLIDEVELIGRYSLKQRAKSYAELARWLGELEASSYADVGYKSGLASVVALTDDFQSAILEERGDREKVPSKLKESNSEADILLADQAEQGMRVIEGKRTRLARPYESIVQDIHDKVRSIHGAAYSWEAPPVPSVEALSSTRMREYVKGWITEWDLRRLAPDDVVEIEISQMKHDYTEDKDLEAPTEEERRQLDSDSSQDSPHQNQTEADLQPVA